MKKDDDDQKGDRDLGILFFKKKINTLELKWHLAKKKVQPTKLNIYNFL